ncbi:MAG: ECF-type sigma factor [Planctomycetaceae bacterium]
MEDLEADSPRQREVVEHRFFGGFSIEETAQLMGLGQATVKRDWKLARAKLYAGLKQS